MVDWKSPAEIQKDAESFSRLIHVLLGLYIWEFVISVPFDYSVWSGKRAFRWPLIFYFAGRYSLMFSLIGIAIALNVTTEVNCQSLYLFNQLFGNAAIGLASINLSIRTVAVWSQSLFIVIPLVLAILGHWSLLLHGLLIKAVWIEGAGCVITNTNNGLLAATFIYSMCFDFSVLLLTGYKLVVFPGGSEGEQKDGENGEWKKRRPVMAKSRLVKLIFGDGLIFFIVAFVANLIATVFMLLNLNPVMSIIANVPAAVASTIVSTRAVRRLTKFTTRGAEMYASASSPSGTGRMNTHGQNSTMAFRVNNGGSTMGTVGESTLGTVATETTLGSPKGGRRSPKGDGMSVHIQMDTLSAPAYSGPDKDLQDSDVKGGANVTDYVIEQEPVYDEMGNVIPDGRNASRDTVGLGLDGDVEAQEIRREFKRPPY